MSTAAEPIVFNPFDPEFRANPYPIYRRLREEDPTHLTPLGFRVFSRYADCAALLHHPDVSSDARHATGYAQFLSEAPETVRRFADRMQHRRPFLFMDPPDHTRLRGLVAKAFTPRVVEGLRPRVDSVVAGLLDAAAERARLEVIEEYAYPLPVVVICELLGVPTEDQELFKGWSRALARSLDPDFVLPADTLQERMEAVQAFDEYFTGLIAWRRGHPGDDLLSALIAAEERGDQLSEDELLATCTLLLVAGHETTVNLIGNGALALLRNPEQRGRLRADPALARSAVEEVLRYDPPVQLDGRIAMTDIEVGGVTVAAGEQAMILLAAANRDPEQFDDPDAFEVTRSDNRHLSFGHGIHFCLGAPLARLEGQVALTALVRRFPDLALEVDDPPYKENVVLRGLASLPVTL